MTATTTLSTSQATATIRLARTRVAILTCCYALLSLWALLLSVPGIGALVTGQLPDPSFRFAAVGATCFKILTVGPALAVALTGGAASWRSGRSSEVRSSGSSPTSSRRKRTAGP